MLSRLLNPEHNSPGQQASTARSQLLQSQQNTTPSPLQPRLAATIPAVSALPSSLSSSSPPLSTAASVRGTADSGSALSSSSCSKPDAPMAASTMTVSAMSAPMQNQDDHRPDLPRPYKCPMCDKAFHRLEHQTRHIRTHTGEKPHACNFPGCTKRFSRSDELTRHSRIHSNPNSRRGNKQHAAAATAAAAALQAGMYDNAALQQQMNHHAMGPMPPTVSQMPHMNHLSHVSQPSPMAHMSGTSITAPPPPPPMHSMMPPPPKSSMSAPTSQLNSPNTSPPHSYVPTYTSAPGSFITRNVTGDISPAAGQNSHHRAMDINLLASAASQVEREDGQVPGHHLSLPTRHNFPHTYHSHPYGTGRMPSLSSYHYSSPTSQPMSRSHSHEDDEHRPFKKSRPGSPQSTAPPSPSFSHESTSPTPDHTPLATPSHSPRLRPQYFHNGVQLPTLHHLSLQNQPPPALAPVEPSADGLQPYVPVHHSGPRISEIMQAGDGAQRKLPIPMVATTKDSAFSVRDLIHPSSRLSSGRNSARVSEAGNDLHERY